MIPDAPTEAALNLLRRREGFDPFVHRGPAGNFLAGYGHALTAEELEAYPLGSEVPESVLRQWFESDTLSIWQDARDKASEIGLLDLTLVEGLFAVNYQLGVNWNLIHTNTWRLLKAHRWQEAAEEVQDSAWFRQTPARVRDFQEVLARLE